MRTEKNAVKFLTVKHVNKFIFFNGYGSTLPWCLNSIRQSTAIFKCQHILYFEKVTSFAAI